MKPDQPAQGQAVALMRQLDAARPGVRVSPRRWPCAPAQRASLDAAPPALKTAVRLEHTDPAGAGVDRVAGRPWWRRRRQWWCMDAGTAAYGWTWTRAGAERRLARYLEEVHGG